MFFALTEVAQKYADTKKHLDDIIQIALESVHSWKWTTEDYQSTLVAHPAVHGEEWYNDPPPEFSDSQPTRLPGHTQLGFNAAGELILIRTYCSDQGNRIKSVMM